MAAAEGQSWALVAPVPAATVGRDRAIGADGIACCNRSTPASNLLFFVNGPGTFDGLARNSMIAGPDAELLNELSVSSSFG